MERNSLASAPGVTQEAIRNLSLNMTTPLEIDGAVVTEVVGVTVNPEEGGILVVEWTVMVIEATVEEVTRVTEAEAVDGKTE